MKNGVAGDPKRPAEAAREAAAVAPRRRVFVLDRRGVVVADVVPRDPEGAYPR